MSGSVRSNLRFRLALLVAVGATTVGALAALALYLDVSREVSDAITIELQLRMDALEADGGRVEGGLQRPLFAQVIDASGEVVAPEGLPPLLDEAELRRARAGEVLVDRPVPGFGGGVRVLAQPIEVEGASGLVGVAAASTAPVDDVRDRLLLVLLVATPALSAALGAVAWFVAGAALRPVRNMARRAETISMSSPGERLPEPGGSDEIAELSVTLNSMLDRIEATVARERSFVDNASHELRTPLSVVRAELELALGEDDPEVVRSGVGSALEETDRLVSIARDLLTLARADAREVHGEERCDLADATRRAVGRVSARTRVEIEVDESPASPVVIPEVWLDRVLENLLHNAADHAAGTVRVTVGSDGEVPFLVVADDGPGFAADVLPVAFDRFTRGEDAGRAGAGLGLAIVKSVCRAVGAGVTARNGPPLGGAVVEVRFPGPLPRGRDT